MNYNQLKLTNQDGQEEIYDVLLDFTSEELNKSFIVVAPTIQPEDDPQVRVTPYSYVVHEDGSFELLEIQTREEFELVKNKFNEMMNPQHHDHGCGCNHGDDDHECCGGHGHHHHDDEDHECCGGHGHHHHDDEDHECQCHNKE